MPYAFSSAVKDYNGHCAKLELNLKDLEREPLRYWKGFEKVTLTRPFLLLDEVTNDEHANVI